MRIFVTGGTGFIGRYTVRELIKKKHRVLVLSADPVRLGGADVLQGNLSDVGRWKARLKKFKPEVAIHLAWEGIPDFSYRQSAKNLEYGLALFTALVEAGSKRIVAAGTSFECGSRVGAIDDNIPVAPTTAFTAAKHSLHIMGEMLAKERGMDFIWLRPYNPYGNGQRAGSLIPSIVRSIEQKTPLTLKYPLAQGDFIYVADVARAFVAVALRGKGCATYNVGSGHLTPVRDIARLICEEMDVDKPYADAFARTTRGKLTNAAYAGLKNIYKDLGWRPLVGIKKGIQKTVADFKKTQSE